MLAEGGAGVKTEIYVDDATMVLWAKSALDKADGPPGLNRMAYEVAAEWTYMVVDLLKLQTSDKNVLVPNGPRPELFCEVASSTIPPPPSVLMPSILVSTRWRVAIAMRPNSENEPPPTSIGPTVATRLSRR